MMAQFNSENISRLGQEVVDCWDQEGIVTYAMYHLEQEYWHDEDKFHSDWKEMGLDDRDTELKVFKP